MSAADEERERRAEMAELSAEEFDALPRVVFGARLPAWIVRYLWRALDLAYLVVTWRAPLGVRKEKWEVPARGSAFTGRVNLNANREESDGCFVVDVVGRYDHKCTRIAAGLRHRHAPLDTICVGANMTLLFVAAGLAALVLTGLGAVPRGSAFCYGSRDTVIAAFEGGARPLGVDGMCPEVAVDHPDAPRREIRGPRRGTWDCMCAGAGDGAPTVPAASCDEAEFGAACRSGRTTACAAGPELCTVRETFDLRAATVLAGGPPDAPPHVHRAAVAGRAAAEAWRPPAESECCRRPDGEVVRGRCEVYRPQCSWLGGWAGLALTGCVNLACFFAASVVGGVILRELAWTVAYPRIRRFREEAADRRIEARAAAAAAAAEEGAR